MHILLGSETYFPAVNGAAVFSRNLAREMKKRGHHVSVLTTSLDFSEHVEDDEGVSVFRLRSFPTIIHPSRFSVFNRGRIFDVIRKVKPDVIHLQNLFIVGQGMLDAAIEMKIPVLETNHLGPGDVTSFLPLPGFMVRIIDDLMWKHLASLFKKCDYFTAPSRYAFQLFAKYGVNLPGEVVSNGIDLSAFNPVKSGMEGELKRKYSIPDKPVILYTGRLEQGKEIDVWLKTIPHVLRKVDAHFVLLGPGVRKKRLIKLAGSLGIAGNVTFIDPVPYAQIPDFYRLADIFAISSIIETQGLVVLEAMATGLPIVAADCAALPELVRDGENGYLFAPGDSRAMAEPICRILGDPELAKKMGERSIQLAGEHDIRRTFDAMEAIYKKLAGG